MLTNTEHRYKPAFDTDTIRTNDLESAHNYISKHLANHFINVANDDNDLHFDCKRWETGDIKVCKFRYGVQTEVKVEDPEDESIAIIIPFTGQLTIVRKDFSFTLNPGNTKVISIAQPNRFITSADFTHTILRVRNATLMDFLATELNAPLNDPVTFDDDVIPVNEAINYLLDFIDWTSTQLNSNKDKHIQNSQHLARHTQDMILSLLISTISNNYQEVYRSKQGRPAAPSYVRKAEDYIREHACEAIVAGDIAREIGVSTRTLYLGFQQFRNYSIAEFLKDERLIRARKELLTARQRKLTVTEVAFSCGFLHLSKFALAYYKKYGEKPSETIKNGI